MFNRCSHGVVALSIRLTFIPFLIVVCSLFAVHPAEAQTAPATGLVQGARLSREIKGADKQYFELKVAENSVAGVSVEQHGADVAVRLVGPDGGALLEANQDPRSEGTETLEFVSTEAKTWKIEVRSVNQLQPPHRFDIAISRIEPATERDRSLFNARVLAARAWGLLVAGKGKEALTVYDEALSAMESVQGPKGIEVGIVLSRLGLAQIILGDLPSSHASTKRALAIFEQTVPGSFKVADALFKLGRLEMFQNNLGECESLYLRGLSIGEKVLGDDHPEYAGMLNELGVLYKRRAELDRAAQMYERALAIIGSRVGKDDLQLAQPLKNIGTVKFDKGDYAAAIEYDSRALEICRKKCGEERLLTYMFALAEDYVAAGRWQEAETLMIDALAAYERRADPMDPDWPNTLAILGKLYLQRDEIEKARQLLIKAIGTAEKQGGYGTSPLVRSLLNYGILQVRAGELGAAEQSLRRALVLAEKAFAPSDLRVLEVLNALALLHGLKGDIPAAIAMQEKSNQAIEQNLLLNLSTGTEQQRYMHLQLTASALDQSISLDVDKNGGVKARELAVLAVLQRKGRVLDALAHTSERLRRRSSPEDLPLLDRLMEVNTRLAQLILQGRGSQKAEDYSAKVEALQNEKSRIEIELSRRTSGRFEPSQNASVGSIRAVIPPDAALIEFVRYRPIGSKRIDASDLRYVAYVIRSKGEPSVVPIGNAAEIDSLISGYRSVLRDLSRRDSHKLAKSVYAKIMGPVRPALGDANRLIISPEGELNLMPFESLIGEKNKFLIEDFSVSYVTSGRDLLRMQRKGESLTAPVVFADPDFGQPRDDLAASRKTIPVGRQRSVTVAGDLSETYFTPLDATAAEAEAIRKLFPGAEIRTSRDATETALKSVNSPQILHIATHGFFLSASDLPGAEVSSAARPARLPNPLLRSGLALSGANTRGASTEDGLHTALEAASLDLWGTKLVVLSACDTGVGEVRAGEGVFGLRRAFALAGAESLVMSLWPVSDKVTRELMVAYYTNLKAGLGRGESLRRAKLEMLQRPARRHPFHWASFIQSGEWADLNGRR